MYNIMCSGHTGHGMLSARNFGLILALCVIIRVLPDPTFEYKDTICPYSHVERRFKALDAFFLEKACGQRSFHTLFSSEPIFCR